MSEKPRFNPIVAWLTRQIYTTCSWMYDFFAWSASGGMWYRWVLAAERFVGKSPVLELGCGRGRLAQSLARHGHTVTAIDKSQQMAEATRRRLARSGLAAQVICGDAREIPLSNASVATVVSTFPPFVHEKDVWSEVARIMRPGGRWVIILGFEGFSLRVLLLCLAGFFEHIACDREASKRIQRMFPRELSHDVTFGRTRVPVYVLSRDNVLSTIAREFEPSSFGVDSASSPIKPASDQ